MSADRGDGPAGTDLPDRARVVIVGGGVIGTSIAYHLARLGWTDLLLLERDKLTSGTTWHAAGLITSAGMVDETALFMSRYSRDLYATLEEETGLSTGFRAVGHLSVATTPHRLEALRREAMFVHGFGVEDHQLSPAEIAELWPLLRTDDLTGGFYVADEGRADPVGVAMSLARGARNRGATLVEGVPVTGLATEGTRVTGVVTDRGVVEAEVVVVCAGMWSRQLGDRIGVDIPLQAAEHYYLITEPMAGIHRDLPVVEDPDGYGYFRPEGEGLLVGLFEPEAAAWSLDGVPGDFSFGELPPDFDRLAPFVEVAMRRVPALADTGILKFFCGPESFTADVHPLLGPTPELDNLYVAAGLNSLGILLGGGVGQVMAHWIADGEPPVDVTGYAVDRTAPHETTRRFRRHRTTEQLGVLFGDAAYPSWRPRTARGVRRSALHERLAAQGAHFNASAGWEFAEWFDPSGPPAEPAPGFGRPASFPLVAAEHEAVRERVGILDMSLMAKFAVQGPDAVAVLSRLSANRVDREPGRVVYTQWLTGRGGIAADLTVTRLSEERFLVVASDIIQRRIEPMIRRATRPGEHCTVTDVTSGTVLLSVQGPRSRQLLERVSSADLSTGSFPYLTAQTIDVGWARALALRITYLGELGYELHMPAEYGVGAYDALLEAGDDLGVRPVGLSAMTGLRLEKGYRDLGVDIDNTDNPLQAGLGFAVSFDKPGGFTGRRALLDLRATAPYRSQLVSLVVDDPDTLLFGNEPVLGDGEWVGYVRAAAYGHTLGASVGLAMVESKDGVTPEWLAGGRFEVDTPGGPRPVTLASAPPYDPARTRILV